MAVCPLTLITMTRQKEPCIEERCQWWISDELWEGKGSCAISVIAARLGSIDEKLEALASKK